MQRHSNPRLKAEYAKYLRTEHWKNLRWSVYLRDHYCRNCHWNPVNEIHHLNYRTPRRGDLTEDQWIELCWQGWYSCTPYDLIGLCSKCHEKEEGIAREAGAWQILAAIFRWLRKI
jgi:hypothetical protein